MRRSMTGDASTSLRQQDCAAGCASVTAPPTSCTAAVDRSLSAIPFQRLQGVHLDHHPFGFQSTADQVIAGINLSGKRTIVTAASSGIGVETARVLASAGADVTLAVRRLEAGGNVVADITASTDNDGVHVAALDLTDLSSHDKFVAEWEGPPHILINNAGVMRSPRADTPHGWALQFAPNHLGHFARWRPDPTTRLQTPTPHASSRSHPAEHRPSPLRHRQRQRRASVGGLERTHRQRPVLTVSPGSVVIRMFLEFALGSRHRSSGDLGVDACDLPRRALSRRPGTGIDAPPI